MSAAQALIDRLTRLGVRLQAEGGQLRINAPKGVLDAALKQELSARKAALLALLAPPGGIPPAPEGAVVPLTPGQQRLWDLSVLQTSGEVYNVSMVYRLQGPLDVAALDHSLRQIHRRHAVLRTRVLPVDGQVQQQTVTDAAFELEITDLGDLDDMAQTAAIDDRLDAEIRRTFDLSHPPLWRATLLRLGAEAHVLMFIMHHMVFDLASKTLFLRELEALYAGQTLPELQITYRDFACHQQDPARRARADGQLSYWQGALEGGVPELLLPTDHPRPPGAEAEGQSLAFAVPPQTARALQVLTRKARCSLYMTLLAAFHTLLHRYTGQIDQIICSPFACRNSTDVEPLIGYFNNILPIRTYLSGDPDFATLLSRVRQATMQAMTHQDVPFQQIAELPGLAHIPLTRGMFNFRGEDSAGLALKGIYATAVENRRTQADFDLALYMGIENGRLCGVMDYNAKIFAARSIRAFLKNFNAILAAVAATPDQPLSALPMFRQRFDEIETALVQHPKVDQAEVVVRSDARGANRVAYLVLNEDDVPSQGELQAVIQERILGKQPPLIFIPLDQLPTLQDGSLDLAALPAPANSRDALGHDYTAPRNALEEQLTEIWQRVLWSERRIGIHDNFFDLGGHSLLSVQLIAETEKQLGCPVPLTGLGQLSTIAEFAALLKAPADTAPEPRRGGLDAGILRQLQGYTIAWSGKRARPDALITGLNSEGGKMPIFWVVQRYLNLSLIAEHLGPDQPVYGLRSGHNVMGYSLQDSKVLARYYVDEILEVQPGGPFVIGGICQASEIALQIALQLQTRGHDIRLLILQDRVILQDYAGRVAFLFGDISDRSPYCHFARPELGWRKYYTGDIDVQIIQGAHGTYFQPRNIRSLTGAMQSAFDAAASKTPGNVAAAGGLQRLTPAAYQARLRITGITEPAPDRLCLTVSVENAGPEVWQASAQSGVFLGARWVNPESRGARGHDRFVHSARARCPLTATLAPGGTATLTLDVPRPADPRLCTLEVDMVDEGIAWFADVGSTAARIDVLPRETTGTGPQDAKEPPC